MECKKPINELQKQILRIFFSVIENDWMQPTIKEVAHMLENKTSAGVSYHFRILEARGFWKLTGSSRGIRLTKKGWDYYLHGYSDDYSRCIACPLEKEGDCLRKEAGPPLGEVRDNAEKDKLIESIRMLNNVNYVKEFQGRYPVPTNDFPSIEETVAAMEMPAVREASDRVVAALYEQLMNVDICKTSIAAKELQEFTTKCMLTYIKGKGV